MQNSGQAAGPGWNQNWTVYNPNGLSQWLSSQGPQQPAPQQPAPAPTTPAAPPPPLPDQPTVPMTSGGAQNGLNSYFNTPGYQLTNGADALARFQASPGYQFQVDQAVNAATAAMAARGLGQSGALANAITTRASDIANTEWNNWMTNQQNQFGNYQNNLSGLTGLGAQNSGANQANTMGTNLASLLMSLGNQQSSLWSNLGAAQSGNMMNAGIQGIQGLLGAAGQANQGSSDVVSGILQAVAAAIASGR